MDNTIDLLGQQIEDKISTCTSYSNDDQSAAKVDVAPPNETLSSACLKKKEVHTRSSKRQKLGWEEKHNGKKKRQSKLQVLIALSFSFM
jgi:hypothetical protein